MSSEEQREYWRLAQRKHRIKQASLKKAAVFTPRLIRFERCSFCKQWHPTEAILSNGSFARFTLDSYHSKKSILTWVRGVQAGLPKEAGYIDGKTATDLCIKDLMENEGYAEDAAREEAKKLIRNDNYRNKLVKFHHDKAKVDAVNARNLKMCMSSRMQLYNENEDIARANCMIILEDPLYRHFPPGLVKDPQGRYDIVGPVLVPVEIDSTPELTRDPALMALGRCFTMKMQKTPSMDPEKAVEECMSELRAAEQGETEKQTVGDLFGKSAAEIQAMTKRKPDPTLTVGDLYGKSAEQIRAMSASSEDEAYKKCVQEKMKEGKTRAEAEKICEALTEVSADRKLEPAEGVAGQTHVG